MFLDEYRQFTCKEKYTVIAIAIIDLMSFCSSSLLSLFLTKEVAEKGENLLVFGISIRVSSVLTLLSSLLWGIIVPKFGAKNVFLCAVTVSRLCTTLYGTMHYIENSKFYTDLAYTLKGIEAIGACAYFIAGYAILFSIFPEEMGAIRGLLETVAGIGANLGPVLGELLITIGDPSLPFYLVGGFFLLFGLFSSPFLENINDCEKYKNKTLGDFLKIPTIWMTFSVILVVSFTSNFIQSRVSYYFTNLNYFSNTSLVYLIVALAFVMTSPIWGYIAEKEINFVWMMPTGLYLTGFSLILLEPVSIFPSLKDFKIYKLLDLCLLGVSLAMAVVPTYRSLTQGAINRGFESTLSTHSYVCSTWSFIYALGEILNSICNCTLKNYDFTNITIIIALINILIATFCTLFLYNSTRNRTLCCSYNFGINLNKK